MEEIKSNVKHKYFAAANSYNGFINYFDKVFDSKSYNRIYVLKGGPGTGKSSFMKNVSAHFEQKECFVEEIYCSSDPHSLDGVIIRKNGNSVAILDGTAPHERDAITPGAIDEIINLGVGWDSRFLTAQRDEILSISKEKALSYKTAYGYLKIAGQAYEFINNLYKDKFDIFKAKTKAETLLKDIPVENSGKIYTRLISSFGRYGSYRLSTLENMDLKLISICGTEFSAALFLNCCFDVLKKKRINIIHLPCPLDPTHTDAIYLPDHKLAIVCGDGEINANDYTSFSATDTERIRAAERIKEESLVEAKRWFTIASNLHFRLEEIYGNAMNFEINNQTLDQKIKEIENILDFA